MTKWILTTDRLPKRNNRRVLFHHIYTDTFNLTDWPRLGTFRDGRFYIGDGYIRTPVSFPVCWCYLPELSEELREKFLSDDFLEEFDDD